MLMHANWTQGLDRQCKSLHWKLTLGEKEHHTWDSNLCQYCAWLFSQTFYRLSYSPPQILSWGQSSHVLHFSHVQVIPQWPCVSCCQILHCFIFLSFQTCPGESEMCDWRLCIVGGCVHSRDDKLTACFFFVASQLRWLYSLIIIFLSLLAVGSEFSQKS